MAFNKLRVRNLEKERERNRRAYAKNKAAAHAMKVMKAMEAMKA